MWDWEKFMDGLKVHIQFFPYWGLIYKQFILMVPLYSTTLSKQHWYDVWHWTGWCLVTTHGLEVILAISSYVKACLVSAYKWVVHTNNHTTLHWWWCFLISQCLISQWSIYVELKAELLSEDSVYSVRLSLLHSHKKTLQFSAQFYSIHKLANHEL